MPEMIDACILISAGAEWRALLPFYTEAEIDQSPYGEYFLTNIADQHVCFMHGGWGKVAAAGSTQYAVDRWAPLKIINIGTCGGFKGYIQQGEVIIAKKTIIYDIYEQMSDPDQAVEKYSVDLDLSWLPDPAPQPLRVETLLSADRDIRSKDIPWLIEKFKAPAADWESGAIAWVSNRNNLPCLILRAVSDLVGTDESAAYANYTYFEGQCQGIMANFAHHLPAWLEIFKI